MGKTKEGEVQDAKERKENERQEAQKRGTFNPGWQEGHLYL